jgi:thymidylate kinase
VFVALIGGDGAGKTTVVAAARQHLLEQGRPCWVHDRFDLLRDDAVPAARILHGDAAKLRSCASEMPAKARLLFLFWQLSLSLEGAAPSARAADVVLSDGYWMKHGASEVAHGADPSWVLAVAAGMPAADLVVHLRVDPRLAWDRKRGEVLPYECGYDPLRSRAAFVAHQRRVQAVLDGWGASEGWVVLDGAAPVEVSVERLLTLTSRGAKTSDTPPVHATVGRSRSPSR